ncbi:hypothetical protein OROHE_000623 [Orobanche hederae]
MSPHSGVSLHQVVKPPTATLFLATSLDSSSRFSVALCDLIEVAVSGGGKVPLTKEMPEEVNVLIFGHLGSVKYSIIGKVLESGGHLSEEQIESYKNKSKDESQIEEKPNWSVEDYFPNLMMKTKNATIGVLVLSGVLRDDFSPLETTQVVVSLLVKWRLSEFQAVVTKIFIFLSRLSALATSEENCLRMISSRSSKKAFIPIELSKLQDYGEIESLGFLHPNMLVLNDITQSVIDDAPLGLLVAEDVDTIDWFLNGMFQKFVEDHEFSAEVILSKWSLEQKDAFMKHWWDLIAKDSQWDVVNGLVYLYSLGMSFGGLRGHIYVSRDKHGRILPHMDKMKTYEDNIEDLVQIMIAAMVPTWGQERV